MPFYPGPGLAGTASHRSFYLTWKAREVDYSTKFIELAARSTYMPYYVIDKMIAALSERGRSIKG